MARIGVVDVPVAIKLVELPTLGERPVYVNPAYVSYVLTGDDDSKCELRMVGSPGSFTVRLSAKDVVSKFQH